MSAFCGACNTTIEKDGSEVKCSGQCDRVFHDKCIKEQLGTKTRRATWKCSDCKTKTSSQSSARSSGSTITDNSITKEFLKRVLEDFKNEVFKELSDFKSTAEFHSNTIDTNNQFMSELKTELAELKRQNQELLGINKSLKNEVGELRDRVRTLEQYTRRCNVEICGIPVTRGEDVQEIVKDVGTALGVPIKEKDIAAAHRIPSYNREVVPSIVVQFERRKTRDSWITSFKQKKTLTASEVNRSFAASKVWVNEHLSPENKILLSKLKKKCKDIGFKYAWCRDGKFYARKSDGERFQRILTENDIEKLK